MKLIALRFLLLTLVVGASISCGESTEHVIDQTQDSEISSTEPHQADANAPDQGGSTDPILKFEPDIYLNGPEVVEFVDEVGPEKPFPNALRNGAPILPLDTAKQIAFEFLADTRVLLIKEGLRGHNVELITDFCDNTVNEKVFVGKSVRQLRDTVGAREEWSIVHTDSTDWNAPYVTGRYHANQTGYIARGWDAVGPNVLWPPEDDGPIRFGSNPRHYIRVFENPECPDPKPVLQQSAEQWSILGLEVMVEFPEFLNDSAPPVDPEVLVETYDEIFQNLISFSNLEGYPAAIYCSDHTGLGLSPYIPEVGKPFEWRIEAASEVRPNAIWIVYNEPGKAPHEKELILVGYDDETKSEEFRVVVAGKSSECSVEAGLAYIESVRHTWDR